MVNFDNNGSLMILILNGLQNILAVARYSLKNYYLKKLNTYLHDCFTYAFDFPRNKIFYVKLTMWNSTIIDFVSLCRQKVMRWISFRVESQNWKKEI